MSSLANVEINRVFAKWSCGLNFKPRVKILGICSSEIIKLDLVKQNLRKSPIWPKLKGGWIPPPRPAVCKKYPRSDRVNESNCLSVLYLLSIEQKNLFNFTKWFTVGCRVE